MNEWKSKKKKRRKNNNEKKLEKKKKQAVNMPRRSTYPNVQLILYDRT